MDKGARLCCFLDITLDERRTARLIHFPGEMGTSRDLFGSELAGGTIRKVFVHEHSGGWVGRRVLPGKSRYNR